MKNKMLAMQTAICICTLFLCIPSSSAESDKTPNPETLIKQHGYSQDIQQLQKEVFGLTTKLSNYQNQMQQKEKLDKDIAQLKDSFHSKTMENVNIALQSANRATTLVSVFAIVFTVFTVLLSFWGIRELSSIRRVRLDAEKYLTLTKHFSLATVYLQANLLLEALREFLNVIALDANNEIAHTQLGYLYMSISKPDNPKSKFYSSKAIEINPNNYTAYLNLGVVMAAMGAKKDEVLSIFLKAEAIAFDQMADDITIGKIKLFAGHNYQYLNRCPEAEAKYNDARTYFERYKDSSIEVLAATAKRWLTELEDNYKKVTKKVTAKATKTKSTV